MEIEVGVIVATYNGEKFISEQLTSILNQTVKPNCIIVSDGNSTDKTIDICENILCAQKIPYEILTSEKRLSVVENFEKALMRCDCEYIFFSDQDDVWLSDKIEKMLIPMRHENVGMAFSNAYIVDSDLEVKGDLWNVIGINPPHKTTIYAKSNLNFVSELLKHNVVTGMCMCIKSDLKAKILPFSVNSLHDAWIALIAANCGSVLAINECLVKYRQHGENVVGTSTNLRQMIKNGKKYKNKVQRRRLLIEELLNVIGNDTETECKELLEQYLEYLCLRNRFLNRQENILYLFKHMKKYKKFEYKYLQILFKDFIASR